MYRAIAIVLQSTKNGDRTSIALHGIALTLHHQDNIDIIHVSMSLLISVRLKISSFMLTALFVYGCQCVSPRLFHQCI